MPQSGRDMKILRDLRLSTKVLILYEMTRSPGVHQRDLAMALDVTPQAISEYLRHMEEEGLVEREGRESRPTVRGFQFLQDNLRELGDFTYRAMREINVINSCAAMAGEDLSEGDQVVLALEGGHIVARRGEEGASTGVAARDAREGEDLAVRDLEGILEHRPGSITVVALPSALEGGTARADMDALRAEARRRKHAVVAAVDPVGMVAAAKLKLEVGIRFGVDRAAVDAALRGLDVIVIGGRDTLGDVAEAVEAHNKRSEVRIDLGTVEL